jgi:hypothetical protein
MRPSGASAGVCNGYEPGELEKSKQDPGVLDTRRSRWCGKNFNFAPSRFEAAVCEQAPMIMKDDCRPLCCDG